jgi:hypothetical protein
MRLSNASVFAGCAVVLALAAGCSSTGSNSEGNNAIFIAHYDDVTAGPLPSTSPEIAAQFSQGVKGMPSHTVFSPSGWPENDELATGGPVNVIDGSSAMESPCVSVNASQESSWLQWFLDRKQTDPSAFAQGQFVVSYTAHMQAIEQGGSFKTILWGVQRGTGRFGKIGAITMSRSSNDSSNGNVAINFEGAGPDSAVNFPLNENPRVTVLANVDMSNRMVAYKVDMNGVTFGPFVVNGFPSSSILDAVGGTPAFATVAMMMDKCNVALDDMAVIKH